ncbi:MAG: hypothetical protein ABFQ53_03510 [Patescibacteria group bacterium]
MNPTDKNDRNILQAIILMVVLYAWITLLTALLGIFYPIAIFGVWALLCALLFHKKILIFSKPTENFLSYIFIALAFSLLIALFTVPTVFSGRDQGSLSEAAMRLCESHSLVEHTPESDTFFDINERGKALNFPGFFYTANGGLITQFPLPYISFLGGFFGTFGVSGLIVANCILLFTFILSIATIARHYLSHRYTFVFLAILLTSFSIGWFAKSTLSENIASMLIWSSLALYILLKRTPSPTAFFTFFLTISLLLFTRIEGIWFFMIFAFLALKNISTKTFIKKDLWWNVFFPLTILFVVGCAVFIMNMPFIITMLKAFTKTASSTSSATTFLEKTTYLSSIYATYGLLFPLLITAIASTASIFNKQYQKILLPVVIVLPLMIYYIFPNISGDHPWMLRRFSFALLPATILVSVSFIYYLRSNGLKMRVLKYITLALLLLFNLPSFLYFITYAENGTLAGQVEKLSNTFGDNDLILVDKNTAGDGWSMITNPLKSLSDKHSVYFFDPEDFEKIDTSSFDRTFLITPLENEDIYLETLSEKMKYTKKYILTVDQLQLSQSKTIPIKFPQKLHYTVSGKIYELTK